MSYECSDCGWTSGESSPGDAMPRYGFPDGQQVAHCPECQAILDVRSNTARPIGGQR